MAMGLNQICDSHNIGSCALPPGNNSRHLSFRLAYPPAIAIYRPMAPIGRILEQGLAANPACDTTNTWAVLRPETSLKKRRTIPIPAITAAVIRAIPACGSSGFNALLAGYRSTHGSFSIRGKLCRSVDGALTRAIRVSPENRYMRAANPGVNRNNNPRKHRLLSALCLKD